LADTTASKPPSADSVVSEGTAAASGVPEDAAAASAPPDGAAPSETAAEVDLGRRRFFRQFAGELANTAATMVGAAQALQRTSAELAGSILDPARHALDEIGGTDAAAAAGFRTSFRSDPGEIRFVDQRALPGSVTEYACSSAAEVVWAIRNGIVNGGPAIGQAGGLGLALSAERVRASRPFARRATLRGAATALRNAAPTHASLGWAVGRVMSVYETIGDLDEDGGRIADAMYAEAQAIVAETTDEHGRLVEAGLAAVDTLRVGDAPLRVGDAPLRLLVHGQSGTLAGGQSGTALAIAIAAHHADRPVTVIVPEARPGFEGARITCWELATAGVPHVLVVDAAAPSLIASGEVDAVLVPADRVVATGDVAATIGTYPLAAVAARHGVPLFVCCPSSALDRETADASAIEIGSRPEADLQRVGDVVLAPRGTDGRVPLHDVTPAELVTGYIMADGLRTMPLWPEVG
jgi:methylthioribose-1-phosphate isomerase